MASILSRPQCVNTTTTKPIFVDFIGKLRYPVTFALDRHSLLLNHGYNFRINTAIKKLLSPTDKTDPTMRTTLVSTWGRWFQSRRMGTVHRQGGWGRYGTSQLLLRITLMYHHMVTFCITGPLGGESTSHLWIALTECQYYRALVYSSLLASISCWIDSHIASDLRRFDVTVMCTKDDDYIMSTTLILTPLSISSIAWWRNKMETFSV